MKSKPIVISKIKINDDWVNQDDIPKEVVSKMAELAVLRAASNAGFAARKIQNIA